MAILDAIKRPFAQWFPEATQVKGDGLGTFSGVYLPSVLQMLGVILFMRLGWITGYIGPWKMSLIILMSSTILFVTSLSLTSIVTNMRVGNGGSYYIISRSLGMEFGSAIGILLSVAQLTTIAVCVSGFAISLQEILPHYSLTTIELCTILALAIVSSFPVDFALKTQGLIYIIVLSAIVSVFMGSGSQIPAEVTPTASLTALSFWPAFALFFPAATGIESGMAMSGDLKNPSRSLALGSLASVLTAYLVYASLCLFLSSQVSADLLRSHPLIIRYVSKYSILFVLGVWGATLSSALGGLLTAPRTLQALAKDKILPSFLSKGYGKANHPRAASLMIISIATLMIVLTDMNHLLPVLSMVCLMTYGLLNFVAFFESLLKNPSWRPLFRTHPLLSLFGTAACLISMFMINAGTSFIVIFLVGTLCFWTTKRKLKGNWDDIRYSIFSFFASTATNKLVHIKKNPKSWRPNILAIVDPSLKETNTIHFAHTLNQAKGFLTYGTTLQGNGQNVDSVRQAFAEYFEKKDIACFYHINAHKETTIGNHQIVQNYGLGPLQPNTIILKAPSDPEKFSSFCELIIESFKLQKNIILLKIDEDNLAFREEKKDKQIDLWWGGKYHSNFELSLALAHIMQNDKTYLGATIWIKTLVPNEAARTHMTKLFSKYHQVLRFKKLCFKPYLDETDDFYSHIADYSTEANLTFLGLRAPEINEPRKAYETYFKTLMKKTEKIPSVAYVLAGETLDFQRIFE
jgi:amino acid transporter